ncbi:preprotein translocase subunit SecD [Thermosipho melanesiensis]|uniref:Protein translocase subunit SecD n=2 Tax=Thermosipho melanesiensis TaxID=46541 RepID=A6LP86_THEM4|nr:protein translocase subunit SecD [Thermosipho melanesiensis]ABR31737.1 protein-export membrane protein SecD [Thermosipho melanesiensis BI429]APT74759.1 preprotein translocase subunit SecD [Thermosipho melanesiensis]OOC35078.1 preprotein translocase subunit SecD [Thermosipho melanesiensis]OOC35114.1 preprotein translocase subunit SecD [Thermosipho melanesiensis]OOC36722.1 preprotein translocase subunit SecD [Thermosipho melanesiensis]
MKENKVRGIITLVVIALAFLSLLWPSSKGYQGVLSIFNRIKLGLDISGGARIEYRVDIDKSVENPSKVAEDVWTVLRNRLDMANYTEAVVKQTFREENTFIIVEIPGATDTAQAEQLIGSTGLLWFGQVVDETTGNPNIDPELVNEAKREKAQWLLDREGKKWYLVKKEIANISNLKLVSPKIVEAIPQVDRNNVAGYVVTFKMDKEYVDIFRRITEKLYVPEELLNQGGVAYSQAMKKRLAIVLDNRVQFAGFVTAKITDGSALIKGNFTLDEAKQLAAILKSGALPARLEKVSSGWVAPLLGKDIIEASIKAGIVGVVIVLIYMIVFYGVMGIVADIALLYNTFLLLGVLATTGSILTLPGIAGIILTIGTTVDGNIIIYERIKEEIRRGSSVKAAISTAFSKSFITLFDANLTTIIAGLFLYYFGTGTVKGFAITLIIGVLGSLFVNLVVSRFFLDLFSSGIKVRRTSKGGARA